MQYVPDAVNIPDGERDRSAEFFLVVFNLQWKIHSNMTTFDCVHYSTLKARMFHV